MKISLFQMSYWHPQHNEQYTICILAKNAESALRQLCSKLGFNVRPSEISHKGDVHMITQDIVEELVRSNIDRFREKLSINEVEEQKAQMQDNAPIPMKDEMTLMDNIKKRYLGW